MTTSPRYLIHTTSEYSTFDDDFYAYAYCACGWTGRRFYAKDEGVTIYQAEDDALNHRSDTDGTHLLDESSLYLHVGL